ncbi:hypothetical protein HNR06_002749 [Nocardiopsis arvandica]|uniref:Uncharacterized protein n=1 Tax=Nocardiopsis sinuspersici TaxID=501010 RepID=A0A7Z0BKG8_9ACTN|nr:hypothetical protein [Nocardiopsis sinuspersici]
MGTAVFIAMVYRTAGVPGFDARLRGSGEAVFTADGEFPRIGLYSSPAGADGSACSLVLPGGEERAFEPPPYKHTVQGGGGEWSLVGAHPGAAGEHALVCDGAPGTVYAVAGLQDGSRFFGDLLTALASFVGTPLAGLLVGAPILVTTGVRRSRHRKRLLGERARHPYRP